MGDGGEEGGVGFDKQLFQGNLRGRFPEISGLGESQNSGEGDEKPQIDHPEGEFRVFREAMKNAAPCGPIFANGGQDVVRGKPAVNDDGKVELPGEPELLPEGRPLFLGRREIVMVVESDFADGDDLVSFMETPDEGEVVRFELFPLMRVDAGGHQDEIRVGFPNLKGFPDRLFGCGFDGAEKGSDAGGLGPVDDGISVGVEGLHVEVGVRIDPGHVPIPLRDRKKGKGRSS